MWLLRLVVLYFRRNFDVIVGGGKHSLPTLTSRLDVSDFHNVFLGKQVRDKTREMRMRNSYAKPFLKIPNQR